MDRTKLFFVVIGIITFFGFGYGCTAMSYRNSCAAAEAGIKAQQKQVENNYDSMWKRIQESAQVPDMYIGGLQKVFNTALSGRYGADGSKAVFAWIQEQNPQVDSSVYTKLQNTIEAGRVSFMAEQTQLLDMKRQYETLLTGSFSSWLVGGRFRFPTINLDDIKILTSEQTQEAFTTHKADKLKIAP